LNDLKTIKDNQTGRGGARQGAGRKAGAITKRTREVANKAVETGLTPLEFMLSIMRDESADRNERLDMAKAAAPFIHPKLSSISATVEAEVVQKRVSSEPLSETEWEAQHGLK
jgi:hypothetical protein